MAYYFDSDSPDVIVIVGSSFFGRETMLSKVPVLTSSNVL